MHLGPPLPLTSSDRQSLLLLCHFFLKLHWKLRFCCMSTTTPGAIANVLVLSFHCSLAAVMASPPPLSISLMVGTLSDFFKVSTKSTSGVTVIPLFFLLLAYKPLYSVLDSWINGKLVIYHCKYCIQMHKCIGGILTAIISLNSFMPEKRFLANISMPWGDVLSLQPIATTSLLSTSMSPPSKL